MPNNLIDGFALKDHSLHNVPMDLEGFLLPREYSYHYELEIAPASKNGWKTTSRGRMYKQPKAAKYEEDLILLLCKQTSWDDKPIDSPVCARFVFLIPRPRSHFTGAGNLKKRAPRYPYKRYEGNADLDNFCKGTADAITKAGIWKDDMRVVDYHLYKRFSEDGICRVLISLEPLDEF